ncbi:MAG: hypothetical protein ACPHID_03425 [Thermoplasmatota archaeon]
MDPVDAAHRFLEAMGTPAALAFVGPEAAPMFLQSAPPDEILDLVMKRNLIFVSWRRGDATGTWIWSFDRDGRLINWAKA